MLNKDIFNLFVRWYDRIYKVKCKDYTFNEFVNMYFNTNDKDIKLISFNNELKEEINKITVSSLSTVYNDLMSLSVEDYNYMKSLYISRKNKRKVINRRINHYLCNYDKLYFVTLTLNDNSLKLKCIDRWVKKYLKTNFKSFIFNRDYGDFNGRLHYHGLIPDIDVNLLKLHKKNNYNLINYKYGFSSVKEICLDENVKINSYILKVSNHALKFGCGLDNLIYSIDR